MFALSFSLAKHFCFLKSKCTPYGLRIFYLFPKLLLSFFLALASHCQSHNTVLNTQWMCLTEVTSTLSLQTLVSLQKKSETARVCTPLSLTNKTLAGNAAGIELRTNEILCLATSYCQREREANSMCMSIT